MTNGEWIRTLDNQVMRYHLSEKCPIRAGVCEPTDNCSECWRNWFEAERIPLQQMSPEQRKIAILTAFLGDIDRICRRTPKDGEAAIDRIADIQFLCTDCIGKLNRLCRRGEETQQEDAGHDEP